MFELELTNDDIYNTTAKIYYKKDEYKIVLYCGENIIATDIAECGIYRKLNSSLFITISLFDVLLNIHTANIIKKNINNPDNFSMRDHEQFTITIQSISDLASRPELNIERLSLDQIDKYSSTPNTFMLGFRGSWPNRYNQYRDIVTDRRIENDINEAVNDDLPF